MGLYSKERALQHAKMLEDFADVAENYLIYQDVTPEEKEKSLKTIRKAAKNLRKGKYDKVYDRQRYIEDEETRRQSLHDE